MLLTTRAGVDFPVGIYSAGLNVASPGDQKTTAVTGWTPVAARVMSEAQQTAI